jgi:hypothetical protein
MESGNVGYKTRRYGFSFPFICSVGLHARRKRRGSTATLRIENKTSGINPDATDLRSLGFVASGFTPDEKRNVGDGLASGVNPNVGYETRRYVFLSFGFVASGFMPDAPDETIADKPRRYELKTKRRG